MPGKIVLHLFLGLVWDILLILGCITGHSFEAAHLSSMARRGLGHYLQMIIRMDQPLAKDHLEGPASCKLSPGGAGLSQKITRMDRPLANYCLEGPASCKWSSGSTRFFSIFLFILQQIYCFLLGLKLNWFQSLIKTRISKDCLIIYLSITHFPRLRHNKML